MAAWFAARRLGLASTIVPSGSSLALVVVGLAVPPILHAGGDDGWRFAWYFFAGVTVLLAVISFFVQRDRPANAVADSDQEIALDKHAPPAIRARLSPPSFHLRPVLRSSYAWHLGGGYMLYGVAFLLYFTFFQKRLTTDLEYTSQTAGYLFMLLGVAGLAGGMTWGYISDRFGRERTLALTLFLAGIGGFLFSTRLGLPVTALSAILFGSTGLSPRAHGGGLCRPLRAQIGFGVAGPHHDLGGGGTGDGPAHRRRHERRAQVFGALVSVLGGCVRGRCPRRVVPAQRVGDATGVFRGPAEVAYPPPGALSTEFVVGVAAAFFPWERGPAAMQAVHTSSPS